MGKLKIVNNTVRDNVDTPIKDILDNDDYIANVTVNNATNDGTPDNPNTVSSYIGYDEGVIVDNIITKSIFNMTDPSDIDPLSKSFIKITDHNRYMKSLLETAQKPDITEEQFTNALEYRNNSALFGPNNETLAIRKNIYPDMYEAVSNDINYQYTLDPKSKSKRTMHVEDELNTVINSRFVSLYNESLSKVFKRTIRYFFNSYSKYAEKFMKFSNERSDKEGLSNAKIREIGMTINLFGDNSNNNYYNSFFSNYPTLISRCYPILRKWKVTNTKAKDINIYENFEYIINNEVMNTYNSCENAIHFNLLNWYSKNGYILHKLEEDGLLSLADIESMALDALSKSLFSYKKDLYRVINVIITEFVVYIPLPDQFIKDERDIEIKRSKRYNYNDEEEYWE